MKTARLVPLVFLILGLNGVPVWTAPGRPGETLNAQPDWFSPALRYRLAGPFRGGRVTAVAGVAGDPPTLLMGSTGGGVWKSVDSGRSYRNLSDGYFEVGSIGAIAVAPSQSRTIYVGTGSACIRSNVSTGRGVYKSIDGGETWQPTGLPDAGAIGAILVHPADPDLVYVAALGHPFGPNPERGVFRSRDGGRTWDKVLFASPQTGAVDLALNPADPSEIYAALWTAERKPWTIISGGPESGVYKTVDGGDHWARLSDGLPQALMGRIGLAVSAAFPERVYALVEADQEQGGLYRSDNGGRSFQRVNSKKNLLYRPFYYTHVHADPSDANTVYVSNEGFFRSRDGGRTFSEVSTPHGDHHALWINPSDPRHLFQGNDGGATVSQDGGGTWSTQYNQPTAEMYHVVVDDQYPYRLFAEQQDNSTIAIPSLPPTANRPLDSKQNWREVAGCETGPIALHPGDPNIVYGGCKGRFGRFSMKTGQERQYWVYPQDNYGHAAEDMPFRFQRTAPIEVSPHDPAVIYHASQYVHRSLDEGLNWETISPDLTAREDDKQGYSGEPITRDITGEEIYSAIYALRESPLEKGLLWVGSNDGLVHVSRDGGGNWRNVTPDDLPPGGRVQTIDPSPHRPGRALVSVYRTLLDDYTPYLYCTDDYGRSWKRLTDGSNGIPSDHPVRVAREDPDREGLYFAGTEFGMFVSLDAGVTWRSFQLNLPATPVTDLRFRRKDLVISTMGRSLWIATDVSPLHEWSGDIEKSAVHLFSPRPHERLRWSPSRGAEVAAPELPPFGASIHYWLGRRPEGNISLTILDSSSEVIRSFSGNGPVDSGEDSASDSMRAPGTAARSAVLSSEPGLHRFVWDLRAAGPEPFQEGGRGGRGPMAPPGVYKVRLNAGEWSQEAELRLLPDPRVLADGVTEADMTEQFQLLVRIRDGITNARRTVDRIRSVRRTLSSAQSAPKSKAGSTEMIERMRPIEELLTQTESGKVGAQLKPMLLQQFEYLYGMLMGADQRPGRDAYKRLEDLETELSRLQEQLGQVLTAGGADGTR